jgi:hypothetical protein
MSGSRVRQTQKWRAYREAQRQKGVICRMRVRLGTKLRRAAALRHLAAFMTCGRMLMLAMKRTGSLLLLSGAGLSGAIGCAGGTQANAVYEECEYRDD